MVVPGSSFCAEEMAGWWHFNGCDGKVVRDASGRGNDGAITGATLARERSVTSLELDGIDGAVTIPVRRSLDFANFMTATAWVRARHSIPAFRAAIAASRNIS